jgi:hypothetical protein
VHIYDISKELGCQDKNVAACSSVEVRTWR